MTYSALLSGINGPEDLRCLPPDHLPRLASELRHFLIDTVSRTGGHLAAGLGVVELTIALHVVFDTPRDRLVWDVGHQAYPHKILTGRKDKMAGLRQWGGLSGFPRREESLYDTFGVGHSSTSLGAALGMAIGLRHCGENQVVIAVIGDGALGAGMAFEALNHGGSLDENLLVVLNDNDMSISSPVGAISSHLARLLSGSLYTQVREGSKAALRRLPQLRNWMGRWEEHMKGMLMPGTLFEELGFNYIGPIDGHDLPVLITTLRNMKAMKGPRLLHVITRKGMGYAPAENNPMGFHGVSPFERETGFPRHGAGKTSAVPTYTQIFGDWLCQLAAQDSRLVAITPAMCEGSGLTRFAREFPDRYFDVGIAEQHALTLAAGLACEGLKPVVAIYSTFLQRAYDQLIHDIALQNLDVTLAVDRGGLVGPDGATHAGSFDLGFARMVPNLVVAAPADGHDCRSLLQAAWDHPGPTLVRYPRGAAAEPLGVPEASIAIGCGRWLREGRELALLAFGRMVAPALVVAGRLGASVADMRFVKPLDETLLTQLAARHTHLVTIEDNAILGGAGSAVNEWLLARGYAGRILNLGLPDRFVEQGSPEEQWADCGLTVAGLEQAIRSFNETPSLWKAA
ncbi:MAG: 1-deoxy-D-xylulose-5-phosphate synthase [Pseudomonadota bacterium]